MNINKRSGIRKRLRLEVDVYSFGDYLGLSHTRDIDLNGAFITNFSGELSPDDVLELLLHVHDVGSGPLRLRATVSRSTNDGAAVLFDYGSDEFRRLQDLISTYANDGHTLEVPGFWYEDRSLSKQLGA